jgi:hypothetical protein
MHLDELARGCSRDGGLCLTNIRPQLESGMRPAHVDVFHRWRAGEGAVDSHTAHSTDRARGNDSPNRAPHAERRYVWCRPPRMGVATTSSTGVASRALGSGALPSRLRCGRAGL